MWETLLHTFFKIIKEAMRKIWLVLVLVLVSLSVGAQGLFVATYNIRNAGPNGDAERGNGWDVRKHAICSQIAFEQPAVFGAQEVLVGQLHDMLGLLPEYASIGVGRDDGKEAGEYAAIFYKKDQLELLDEGHFWLSETPERPSLGWDAACIRICTWGKFRDKATGLQFCFFTLHTDHVGVVARREAAKLIVARVGEIAKGLPAIVTGDFNVDQTDDTYGIFVRSGLLVDSYDAARQRFCTNGTFNDFKPEMHTDSRIDHVFVSPGFRVDHYAVLTNMYWRPSADAETLRSANAPQQIGLNRYTLRTPSDHYPVFVKLFYQK